MRKLPVSDEMENASQPFTGAMTAAPTYVPATPAGAAYSRGAEQRRAVDDALRLRPEEIGLIEMGMHVRAAREVQSGGGGPTWNRLRMEGVVHRDGALVPLQLQDGTSHDGTARYSAADDGTAHASIPFRSFETPGPVSAAASSHSPSSRNPSSPAPSSREKALAALARARRSSPPRAAPPSSALLTAVRLGRAMSTSTPALSGTPSMTPSSGAPAAARSGDGSSGRPPDGTPSGGEAGRPPVGESLEA